MLMPRVRLSQDGAVPGLGDCMPDGTLASALNHTVAGQDVRPGCNLLRCPALLFREKDNS